MLASPPNIPKPPTCKYVQLAVLDNPEKDTQCYAAFWINLRLTTDTSHLATAIERAIQLALDEANQKPLPVAISLDASQDIYSVYGLYFNTQLPELMDEICREISNNPQCGELQRQGQLRIYLVPISHPVLFKCRSQDPDLMRRQLLVAMKDRIRESRFGYYELNLRSKTLKKLGYVSTEEQAAYIKTFNGQLWDQQAFNKLNDSQFLTLASLSDGKPLYLRRELEMTEWVSPHSVPQEFWFRNSTGECQSVGLAEFEKRMAKARRLPTFTYSENLLVPRILVDFNEDRLKKPSLQFTEGLQVSLSFGHELFALYNPKHPCLKFLETDNRVVDQQSQLFSPFPKVYFAKIPGIGGYGVFAAEDLKGCIGLYAGVFHDSHPQEKQARLYSFENTMPGCTYSNNQCTYAFERGNFVSLINAAPHDQKPEEKALTANVIGVPIRYKKMVLTQYRTLQDQVIPKDTQLLCDYTALLEKQKIRTIRFFPTGSELYPTQKLVEYFKEDYLAGCQLYKDGKSREAKIVLKKAYHMMKSCYSHAGVLKKKKESFLLDFSSSCEMLGNCYSRLSKPDQAKIYWQQALTLRRSYDPKHVANKQRMALLEKKIVELQDQEKTAEKTVNL